MSRPRSRQNRERRRRKAERFYALPCMLAILITASILTAAGHALRGEVDDSLPPYRDAPDIAVPMLMLSEGYFSDRSGTAQTLEYAPVVTAIPLPTDALTAAAPEPSAETLAARSPLSTPSRVPTQTPAPVPAPPTPSRVPTPTPEPVMTPTPEPTLPQPTAITPDNITESYFDHTLFIGDSKTDGMRMWARLGEAHYFCGTNYSAYNIQNKRTSDEAFSDASLDWVLRHFSYDQIYILLGYNEAGYPLESLRNQFTELIGYVHAAQPKARIVIHSVMHASKAVGEKYDYYRPYNFDRINDMLETLAETEDWLYYVDCNPPFVDEQGYLLSDVSNDGEHLTPTYTKKWAQEIMKRAVIPETAE
ncbi:MAG: hypothetical protein IJJ23_05475 [Clostridia bacterium]|nr:hypothetical protein [Clostridia bacterium]